MHLLSEVFQIVFMKFYQCTFVIAAVVRAAVPSESTEPMLSPIEEQMKPKEKQINDLLILQTAEKALSVIQIRIAFARIVSAIALKHAAFQTQLESDGKSLNASLAEAKAKFDASQANLNELAASVFSTSPSK